MISDAERHTLSDNIKSQLDELNDKFEKGLNKDQKAKLEEYKTQLNNVKDLLDDTTKSVDEINDAISILNERQREFNRLVKDGGTGYQRINDNIEKATKNFEKVTSLYSAITKFGDDLLSSWEAADKAASSFSRHLGGSVFAMNELRKNVIYLSDLNKIGIRFNKTTEDLINLQSKYSDELGRTVSMTNEQREAMAAMDAIMGEAGTKLAATLEKFGIAYEEAGRRAGRLFAEASKHGINFSKLSGDVAAHLDLASRYTFVDGVRGLESMALKAAALRLDMQQAAVFANKVSTVEGSATASASLSVLGGSFTNNANPLTMLYEGLNDLEGLQDRIVNMFGNLGKMNYQTGEVEIGAFDKQRIKAASDAAGLDYGSVLDMVQTKTRGDAIRKLTGGRWANDKDFEDLIANVASIDNGRAYVEIGGKKVDIADLSKSDEGELRKKAQSTSDDIKEIAENTRSLTDIKEGAKKQLDAAKARHAEQQNIGKIAKQVTDYLARSAVAIEAIRAMMWAMSGLALGKSIGGLFTGGAINDKKLSGAPYLKGNTPTAGYPMGTAPTGMIPMGGAGAMGSGGMGAGGYSSPFGINKYGNITYNWRLPNGIKWDHKMGVYRDLNANGKILTNKQAQTLGLPIPSKGLQQQALAVKNAGATGNGGAPSNSSPTGGTSTNTSSSGNSSLNKERWKAAGTSVGGMVASMGGQMAVGYAEREVASGNWKKGDTSTILTKGLGNTASFAGMGAMIGGLPGAVIGGILGAAYGFGSAWYDGAKDDILEKLAAKGHYLNGDYSLAELNKILGGRAVIYQDRDLLNKVNKNNDMPAFSKGGVVKGEGSAISDSVVARLSNNEYVVKASQSEKHRDLLNAINEDKVMPIPNSIHPMTALPSQQQNVTNAEGKLKINDFNINLGGTLRLESNGKTADLDLNNPTIKSSLTNMISKELNKIQYSGLNKENYYAKWGN